MEVLIGLSLLSVGIISILTLFPITLRASKRAELRTIGASLAHQKVEELRRDNDENDKLFNALRSLAQPTEPVVFAADPRLAYRLSSTTILYLKLDSDGMAIDDPNDPRDDPGVPRIIIQESPIEKTHPQILNEFRFN